MANLEPMDWQIRGGGTPQIMEDVEYGLWCISENDFLKAEWRKKGINLVWKSENPNNVRFERENDSGNILSGERIAIYFNGEKGGYLYYKRRENGINLEFSKTPKYEWEIRDDSNADGNLIRTESTLAIYSSIEDDFIKGCKRLDCWGGYRVPLPEAKLKVISDLSKKAIPFVLAAL
jgi:hypothetical protein